MLEVFIRENRHSRLINEASMTRQWETRWEIRRINTTNVNVYYNYSDRSPFGNVNNVVRTGSNDKETDEK